MNKSKSYCTFKTGPRCKFKSDNKLNNKPIIYYDDDNCVIDLPNIYITLELDYDHLSNSSNRKYWYFTDKHCRYFGIDYTKRFNTPEKAVSYVIKCLKKFNKTLEKSLKTIEHK